MRAVRALLIAVSVSAALAPAASAADGVTVRVDDGPPRHYSRADLVDQNDVSGAEAAFTVRGQSGDDPLDLPGTSVKNFLKVLGLTLDQVENVAVARTSADGSVVIPRTKIRDGYDGDPKGHRQATFGTDYGQGIRFIRPLDTTPGDQNGLDSVTPTNPHQDLDVAVTTNRGQLNVTASVDKPTPTAGQSVQFTVTVTDPPPGETLRYFWDFGDGGTSDEANPDYTYASAGTNRASVEVTTDNAAGSFSVSVQVGKPEGTPTATATPTATETPNPTGGGTGGGGTGGGDSPTGGGEGTKRDSATGAKRSKGKSERKTDGAKRTPTPTATATATAEATATATGVPQDNAEGSGAGKAGGGSRAGGSNADDDTSSTAKADDGPTSAATGAREGGSPAGEHVEGIVLASAGSIADVIDAAHSAEQAKQDREQARRGGGDSPAILGWAGGGAGLIGLLLLGALREGAFR